MHEIECNTFLQQLAQHLWHASTDLSLLCVLVFFVPAQEPILTVKEMFWQSGVHLGMYQAGNLVPCFKVLVVVCLLPQLAGFVEACVVGPTYTALVMAKLLGSVLVTERQPIYGPMVVVGWSKFPR